MTQQATKAPRRLNTTAYQKWMEAQQIPIHGGHIVFDARTVERKPWSLSGMQVVEIPPGGSTKPQKHMYQALICILEGHGTTEVWMDGAGARKATFEWGPFSLFSPPLN